MSMPEAFSQALETPLETPGLVWLIGAISIAGLVRGFSGFGQALIFVPVAGLYLPPVAVIALITLSDVFSSAALLPRAWGQANRREVGLLVIAAAITVPLGLFLIDLLDPVAIRWTVAAVASTTLLALLTGWRFHGHPGRAGLFGIGGTAGIIGGLTGLTGPMVILFYLAGRTAARTVRANAILFLAALDVVILINLLVTGSLTWALLMLALILTVPYYITSHIGQALFDPSYERVYRVVAYLAIALAVLRGLPIWG